MILSRTSEYATLRAEMYGELKCTYDGQTVPPIERGGRGLGKEDGVRTITVSRLPTTKIPLFTGAHRNQDLIRCEKIGVYMGFCVHRGSSLLWFPVIRVLPVSSHYLKPGMLKRLQGTYVLLTTGYYLLL